MIKFVYETRPREVIWVDYAILAIVAVSAVIGFFRGFLREAVGLATWILAFWLAFRLAPQAAGWLAAWISVHSVRLAVAFGVLFVVVLIAGALINHVLGQFVRRTGFTGTDRGLGAAFGVLRGVAILVILALFAGLTPVPRDQWWQQSLFMEHIERGALWVRNWLPAAVAEEIRFDSRPAGGTDG